MTVHPWRRLRKLSHYELRWHDGGDMGETDHEENVISLRRGMTWAERRSTILHECLHAERGPALEGVLYEREELRVRRAAARILLPDLDVVCDALAWSHNMPEAADELSVDLGTLQDRLDGLLKWERAILISRLQADDAVEGGGPVGLD